MYTDPNAYAWVSAPYYTFVSAYEICETYITTFVSNFNFEDVEAFTGGAMSFDSDSLMVSISNVSFERVSAQQFGGSLFVKSAR